MIGVDKPTYDTMSAKRGLWWIPDNIIIWVFTRILKYWRWRTGKQMFAVLACTDHDPRYQYEQLKKLHELN